MLLVCLIILIRVVSVPGVVNGGYHTAEAEGLHGEGMVPGRAMLAMSGKGGYYYSHYPEGVKAGPC